MTPGPARPAAGTPPASDRAWASATARAVAARPSLWGTAMRQVAVLAAPGWWRRRPRLPLPPAPYLGFRMVTAYGDAGAAPAPPDALTYLEWCRDERRRGRARSRHGHPNRPVTPPVGQ